MENINRNYKVIYDNSRNDIKELDTRLKTIQSKINNILRLVSDGVYNDDIKESLEKLENDKTNISIEINKLKKVSEHKDLNKEDIIKCINTDIDKLNNNDRKNIKNILCKYIKEIKVDYQNIEISFRFNSNISNSHTKAKNERKNSSVYLAPQVGLEPTTYRLTAERSTD